MERHKFRRTAAVAVIAVTLAACSSGSAEDTATTPAPETTTTQAPATTEAPATTMAMAEEMSTGAEATSSPAASLRAVLTAQLQEHVYLAGIAVYNAVTNPDAFEASAGVLDANSQDLAATVASVYGENAGEAFLGLWRSHIGMFVDYTTARVAGDAEGQAQAAEDLTQYAADFAAFLAGANPNLEASAVTGLVEHHVMTLVPAVNGIVDGDPATAFSELKVAAGHMSAMAEALAGAIAEQFPDQFTG